MKNRKVLYYLPLIYVAESIELHSFRIIKYSKNKDTHSLLPFNIFDGNGSLIEVEDFSSGDKFNDSIHKKIFNAIDFIKFSYFSSNPSHIGDISGHISSEVFECFTILEKNKDPSFEHKIQITNGMCNFYQSMEKYYLYRQSIGLRRIEIHESDFLHSKLSIFSVNEDKLFTAMKLYNRCWEMYSIHSYFDKALLARTSIESLLPIAKLNKRNYVDSFWDSLISIIEKNCESSVVINEIYNCIRPYINIINKNIKDNIDKLKCARDKLAHDGVEDSSHINVPFYLIWFPIFWMVLLRPNEISGSDALRLVLFLILMKYDVDEWQKIDTRAFLSHGGSKMTHIHCYSHNSRVIPIYLKRNGITEQDACVIIKNWLENK
ncbi:hypothetical protein [Aeromonas media]|uniref:hypothetical protein n=1 Tax=Aeromonas media TaxID=651 RepID=UPI002B49F26B|nr:hypothetical protein [Aeromonas media]